MRPVIPLTDRMVHAGDIIALDSCYDDERIRELVPELCRLSDLLDLDIPAEDRLWAVLGLLPEAEARAAGCYLIRVTTMPKRGGSVFDSLDDSRSTAAVVAAEAHASGKLSDDELTAAWAAAWDAAWDAARAAAWDAARAAAWDAARDAAWDAARAAARDAAWDAARAAAWAAARDEQIAALRAALKGDV